MGIIPFLQMTKNDQIANAYMLIVSNYDGSFMIYLRNLTQNINKYAIGKRPTLDVVYWYIFLKAKPNGLVNKSHPKMKKSKCLTHF
jgi:hypothetical protein